MHTNHKFLKYLFVLICFYNFQIGKSQDTLYLSNGKTQVVKISEINDKNILYQFCNDSMSPLMYKENQLINKIVLFNGYEMHPNGINKNYNNGNSSYIQLTKVANLPINLESINHDSAGRIDALKNYKPSGLGASVFFTTVILTPIGGAILSTIANKSDISKSGNFNIENTPLKSSPKYISAYQNGAKEKRQTIITSHFASGLMAFVFLFAISYNNIKKL
ncbi:MAG: hypothetical protein Q8K70_00410 [Bacteroidota bacterium]|nr:hypothetical protein [Bacteroidota bacterium]